jgi:hypothetical protein
MDAENGGEAPSHASWRGAEDPSASGEQLGTSGGKNADWFVVRGGEELRCVEEYILSKRQHPVVALTPSLATTVPAFPPGAIREIVGPGVRIYFIPGTFLVHRLQGVLGRQLAPAAGGARIWWPGFSTRSDPEDHPLVQRLEDESDETALEEFARCFDLSRPRVRREIKEIEDSRALAERERDKAFARIRQVEQDLRDARVATEEAVKRAERAEARVDR